MCGICGFVFPIQTDEKEVRIQKMMDTIIHRGPDDSSSYCDENVALGFRRLSIIDIEGGRQPLSNEDGTIWIVFNGEIYNFKSIREELISKGHKFKTRSDTESIVHAYEEWGVECLNKLSGMFSLAIWNSRSKELFLAVDRVGIKPLYYGEINNGFVFASEAKSIFASGFIRPQLDPTVIPYHMAFLTSPFPLTIFRDIKKLEPGSYLLYRNGELSEKKYWDLEINESKDKNSEYWIEKVRTDTYNAVISQTISDVPLGAFLSGGIDSSTICQFLHDASDHPISTYFIAFSKKDIKGDILLNEEPYANIMATELDSIHKSITVSPDVESLLPKLVWHLDEPIGDPAAMTTYLVCKAARETLTVLLSGVGADEVFGGYPRYLAMKYHSFYNKVPRIGRNMINRCVDVLPAGKSAIIRNMKKFAHSGTQDNISAYFRMLSYFNEDDQKFLFQPDFYQEIKDIDIYQYHKEYFEKARKYQPLNQLQYIDFKTFLPCLNLMYTDKMSMAASIEVRVPYLDDNYIEEMFETPCELKLRGFKRKYIMKKAMEGLLPESIIWRRKTGFGAPIHSWISGDLKDMIGDLLSESRLNKQGIFNYNYIRELLHSEHTNKQYYSNHIWQLIVFQIWHDQFINQTF